MRLGIGKIKPTSVTLQMADMSVMFPIEVLEDVLDKVGHLDIPINFIIMDIREDSHVPIIKDRPFLWTASTIINVKKWMLSMEVRDERLVFILTTM